MQFYIPKGHNIETADIFDGHMLQEQFNEMIDELYPPVVISGATFYPARILQSDNAAWTQAYDEFLGDYQTAEVPWEYYLDGDNGDVFNGVRSFLIANPQRIMDEA